jgi:hypothetical protein
MAAADAWDLLLLTDGRRTRKFEPNADPDLVERAAELGRELSDQRLRDRQIQIRKSFVRRESKAEPIPPSAALASSRSEVHLKMELALLWACAGKGRNPRYLDPSARDTRTLAGRGRDALPVVEDAGAGRALLLPTDPYVAEFRLPDYAKLLGLPTPKTAGAARVRRSLDTLGAAGLLWVDRTNGATPRAQLRREDGSGEPYKIPGEKELVLHEGALRPKAEGRYVVLPATFFTNGWAAALTARAIAALLALLVQRGLDPDKPVFIAPSIRRNLYGMGEDSFLRGVAELSFYRLVHHESAPVTRAWTTTRGRVRHAFVPLLPSLANDPVSFLTPPDAK